MGYVYLITRFIQYILAYIGNIVYIELHYSPHRVYMYSIYFLYKIYCLYYTMGYIYLFTRSIQYILAILVI